MLQNIPEGYVFKSAMADRGNYRYYDSEPKGLTWEVGYVEAGEHYLELVLQVNAQNVELPDPILRARPEVQTGNNSDGDGTEDSTANLNEQSKETKTIGMQKIGTPITGLILAVLVIFSGLAASKRR